MTQQIAVIRSVGGFVFDATFEESHTSELEVTDNPVETGVTVSDSAFMKPYKLVVSAAVTDSSLHLASDDQFSDQGGQSRSQVAFNLLRALQASAEPFAVQTGLILYQNMVLTILRASQDKDTSRILAFEADLREIIIVETQTVTYPPRASGKTTHQASAPVSKGNQQGNQQTTPAVRQSLLTKLFNAFGGTSTPGTAPTPAAK